ncbi:uncharacterized protein LOC105201365 [Solenopsis invicta]|uniref:uncharacterized protein LOC105201365 n=1 Tax=Solenopsis invicta TaxID=13686 RepID=UPI0005962518|nr:uncharacterized protein LOC105201365 [Solenopsis invicta]
MTLRDSKSRKFSHCSNMTRRGCRPLIQICACLAFITIAIGQENCDPTKCPGPLAYYENLNCIPVYKNVGDCCATKYTCDHLKKRSPHKCYVNGNSYEVGEDLKDEDADPCDVGCTCIRKRNGIASFRCAEVDCPTFEPARAGCYRKNSPLWCCPGEEVCPENPEDRAICNVDGMEYRDGEYFTVESEPDLTCVCQPGYEGNNVEPFCAKPKRATCSAEFKHASYIFNNCAPIYESRQSPQTDCNFSSRCQNANDTVIHNEQDNSKSAEKNSNDEDVCYFGNMTMHRGEELSQGTDYSSACVKCICEVPPVPTCQRLPNEKCNVTKHMIPLPSGSIMCASKICT